MEAIISTVSLDITVRFKQNFLHASLHLLTLNLQCNHGTYAFEDKAIRSTDALEGRLRSCRPFSKSIQQHRRPVAIAGLPLD